MTKMQAIQNFFDKDASRNVTNAELITLRRTDPQGYEEVAKLSADALGVTLDAAPNQLAQ